MVPKPYVHALLPFEPITFLAFTLFPLPPRLSDSAAHSGVCLTLAARMIHRPLGFRSLHSISSLDWALWVWGLSLLPSPCPLLSRVRGLASASAMSLYCSCYDITYPFTSLLPLGLQATLLLILFHSSRNDWKYFVLVCKSVP